VAHHDKLWLRCVLAYTGTGSVSASLIGALLGDVGRRVGGGRPGATVFYIVALSSLLLAAREWGWVHFPLLERKRQTEKYWAHEFGFLVASSMWGLHIGLGFATRITYAGFWVLVLIALAVGDPAYGAMLMLVYWLGRVLPVWIAPTRITSMSAAAELPAAVLGDNSLYRRFVGLGLLWSAVIAVLLGIHSEFHGGLSLFVR
jgi:hypothetical protein